MNEMEFVIKKCATYERFLEKKFSASGRGLHEKVNSVEHSLSAGMVKKLRLIATIRNKMMHEADYEFHDDKNIFMDVCDEIEKELKISPQSNTKKTCDIEQQLRIKKKVFAHYCILIIFGVIGLFSCFHTSDWGLNDKINNKYQEILNLEDQIKYEKSNIEGIKEKYSKIRFWQNKSREDTIEIEKANTRIKILDAKKSESKVELSKLKKAIGNSWEIHQSPLFMPWVIIFVAFSFYIIVVAVNMSIAYRIKKD